MDMSLGRRTASGISFTPSGLSFTFTGKSSSSRSGSAILETNTGERNRDHPRRRLADTNSSCKTCKSTPRKSKTHSYIVSERTPRDSSRRKLTRKASETELRATLQNSVEPMIEEPREDDNFVEDENHWNIYDPYRDMRMDIDDMSYEELLDLGERIGTVSVAVSKEDLSKCLKKSKYTSGDCATCSICQEEFVEGDELGEVVCKHVYHAICIEPWLKSKNWCPLCKGSASPS